jgi:hypothetical protein
MYFIIITTPHAGCYQGLTRNCDRRALVASVLMRKNLEEMVKQLVLPVKILLFPNVNTHRSRCDMNRPQCRNTNYRLSLNELIDAIEFKGNKVLWNLDIHSFPFPDSWNDFRYYQLVFLSVSNSPFREGNILKNFFETQNVMNDEYVGFLRGSDKNDIMITMQERGIKSILIEVLENERLYSKELMEYDFNYIAFAIILNIINL